jgi:hypothetical protein
MTENVDHPKNRDAARRSINCKGPPNRVLPHRKPAHAPRLQRPQRFHASWEHPTDEFRSSPAPTSRQAQDLEGRLLGVDPAQTGPFPSLFDA